MPNLGSILSFPPWRGGNDNGGWDILTLFTKLNCNNLTLYVIKCYYVGWRPMILENFFSKNKPNTIVIGEIDSSGGKRIIAYSIFGSYLYYKKNEFPEEKENYAYSRGTGVHSEFQGNGFGTTLKNITVEIAKREGYKGMYTDVASNNNASLKVQKKTGFTIVAEVQDKSRPKGIHSIVFKKTF